MQTPLRTTHNANERERISRRVQRRLRCVVIHREAEGLVVEREASLFGLPWTGGWEGCTRLRDCYSRMQEHPLKMFSIAGWCCIAPLISGWFLLPRHAVVQLGGLLHDAAVGLLSLNVAEVPRVPSPAGVWEKELATRLRLD